MTKWESTFIVIDNGFLWQLTAKLDEMGESCWEPWGMESRPSGGYVVFLKRPKLVEVPD